MHFLHVGLISWGPFDEYTSGEKDGFHRVETAELNPASMEFSKDRI